MRRDRDTACDSDQHAHVREARVFIRKGVATAAPVASCFSPQIQEARQRARSFSRPDLPRHDPVAQALSTLPFRPDPSVRVRLAPRRSCRGVGFGGRRRCVRSRVVRVAGRAADDPDEELTRSGRCRSGATLLVRDSARQSAPDSQRFRAVRQRFEREHFQAETPISQTCRAASNPGADIVRKDLPVKVVRGRGRRRRAPGARIWARASVVLSAQSRAARAAGGLPVEGAEQDRRAGGDADCQV